MMYFKKYFVVFLSLPVVLMSLGCSTAPVTASVVDFSKPFERPNFGIERRYSSSDVAVIRPADEHVLCSPCGAVAHWAVGAVVWINFRKEELDTLEDQPANAPVASSAPSNQGNNRWLSFPHFEVDSDRLAGRLASLSRIVTLAEQNPLSMIRITGHTDQTGPAEYNEVLSRRRATTVMNWFVKNGISANRIEIIAAGKGQPAVHEGASDRRAFNRRAVVDLHVGGA